MTHYLPWRPGARDLTAIGVAVPGIRDRIVPGGELQVDTPTAMVGYWNDEAATREKFDGPWLRTGDLARLGDDGLLRIVGRVDELINRGGEKIPPVEVESAIAAHPDVLEASVVGLPDRDLGEVVGAAVVVARPGARSTREQLGRFLGRAHRRLQVAPQGTVRRRLAPAKPERQGAAGRGPQTLERRLSGRPSGAVQEAPSWRSGPAQRTSPPSGRSSPSCTAAASASRTASATRASRRPGTAGAPGSTTACADPEVQRALPRIVSIDGEPCHPFWSIPATKEDLLDNIMVARQVSRVSPAAGYATIGRDELAALYVVSLHPRARGKGRVLRARAELRPPVPAGADHDVGGHHRSQGGPAPPARRAAEQGGVPPGRRAALRRDRHPGLQDAHLRRGRRRGADRRPDPGDAEGGRRLRGVLRRPRRRPRREAHRPRGARHEGSRDVADDAEGPAPRDLHDLRGRVRALGARVPVRRVATLRRHGQHLRERQPPGLPRRGRGQAGHLHRRGAPHRRAERRRRRPAHPGQDHADDQAPGADLEHGRGGLHARGA